MSGWTLREIAQLCDGRLEQVSSPDLECPYGSVGIDTRTLVAGSLFVAVRAQRDGHSYLAEALAKGAIAALVDTRDDLNAPATLPLIRVPDPVKALQRWAAAHREKMPAELIVITGSSGKTTTKDRIASIMARDHATHSTHGNLNNHLGVPLTLLGLRPEHRWGIVEIAMNHPGEIAPLARMCRPRHVVLTTIGWAHIGAFGSREAILAEKLGAVSALDSDGILFHDDDPWIAEHLPPEVLARSRLTFGLSTEADCHPEAVAWSITETGFSTAHTGDVTYRCPGPGALKAALAGILVARELKISGETVRDVLSKARPRALRMEPSRLGNATALLDCYNASPESSISAVEFMLSLPCSGRRYLAFGEMRELGEKSEEAHRHLGEKAAGFDGVFFLGDRCRPAVDRYRNAGGKGIVKLYTEHEALSEDLMSRLGDSDLVLFKGSRVMEMERVFELCRKASAEKGA